MMQKRSMKAVTVMVVAMGAIAALETGAQEEQPVTDVIAAVKQHIALQCKLARERQSSSAQPFEKDFSSVLVRMNCDCLPGEIDRAGSHLSAGKENAMTTQPAFLSRMKIAHNTCSARIFRADIPARCEGETEAALGVADKKAYCGCLSGRVNALDDDTIATAAATANRNFQDRVQAKIKGEPAPAPTPTVLDGIEQACRQAAK